MVKANPLTLSVQTTLSVWIVKQQGIHLLQGAAQSILKENLFSEMKFLQLNISCFNTSLDELWLHQLEKNYSAISLQKPTAKEETCLETSSTRKWECTQF